MKISNKDLDLGLVKRAKAGDYQAFDLLVLKYQSRLISTAFKFVKDQQIAEDLVQDSFIKSFKSIGSFREDSTFYTWIYRITVNTSKNYLVSKKRKDELIQTDISKEISIIGISMKMFLVVTLPVLIGMLIRKFATNLFFGWLYRIFGLPC